MLSVRDIWLGEGSDAVTADELLEHTLPTQTEDLYGVLFQVGHLDVLSYNYIII